MAGGKGGGGLWLGFLFFLKNPSLKKKSFFGGDDGKGGLASIQ